MTFISFAQNFEDVMLWRALKHIDNGFYIDVGAHDPENGSVTKAFYDAGWNGINIEPISEPFARLRTARLRDINLQVCAGQADGEIDIFDVSPSGLATAQASIAEEYRSAGHSIEVRHVPVRTLASICKEHVKGKIHFLKVDVEGFEKEVLLGADFTEFRPWILVIEATYPNSPEVNYGDWEKIVLEAGYRFTYFDGLNRFYVAAEHEELHASFAVPPNFFDGFALSATCFFSRQVANELLQVETRAQEGEARAIQAEARAQQSEVRVTQAEARAQQSEARAAHAEARAMQAEAHTAELLNSTSWRVTAPLRKVRKGLTAIVARCCPDSGGNTVGRVFIRQIARLVRVLLLRPGLRRRVSGWMSRYPILHRRIADFVRTSLGTTTKRPPHPLRLADLSPRARAIYADIRAAIDE
jgi:FkbM family methyltransferase